MWILERNVGNQTEFVSLFGMRFETGGNVERERARGAATGKLRPRPVHGALEHGRNTDGHREVAHPFGRLSRLGVNAGPNLEKR